MFKLKISSRDVCFFCHNQSCITTENHVILNSVLEYLEIDFVSLLELSPAHLHLLKDLLAAVDKSINLCANCECWAVEFSKLYTLCDQNSSRDILLDIQIVELALILSRPNNDMAHHHIELAPHESIYLRLRKELERKCIHRNRGRAAGKPLLLPSTSKSDEKEISGHDMDTHEELDDENLLGEIKNILSPGTAADVDALIEGDGEKLVGGIDSLPCTMAYGAEPNCRNQPGEIVNGLPRTDAGPVAKASVAVNCIEENQLGESVNDAHAPGADIGPVAKASVAVNCIEENHLGESVNYAPTPDVMESDASPTITSVGVKHHKRKQQLVERINHTWDLDLVGSNVDPPASKASKRAYHGSRKQHLGEGTNSAPEVAGRDADPTTTAEGVGTYHKRKKQARKDISQISAPEVSERDADPTTASAPSVSAHCNGGKQLGESSKRGLHFMDHQSVDRLVKKGKQILKCRLCDAECSTVRGIGKHYKLTHSEVKLFPCSLCEHGTNCAYSMEKHMTAKHPFHHFSTSWPAGTTKSNVEKATKGVLFYIKNHKKRSGRCTFCNWKITPNILRLHVLSVHRPIISNFILDESCLV